MKKVLFILVLSIPLVSCSNIDNNTTSNDKSSVNTNDNNEFDEEFIMELESKIETDLITSVHEYLVDNIEELENKEIKNKAIDIYNDYVLRYIEGSSSWSNTKYFIGKGTKEISNDEYLKDETKDEIIKIGNRVYTELSNQGFGMELTPEYDEGIKVGKTSQSVIESMNGSNIEFDSISDDLSGLISLEDNTVIEFNKFTVRRIFKIIDKDGNVQDPHTVLGDLGTELADAEYERQKDELGETKLVDMDKQPEETEDDNLVDDEGNDLDEGDDLNEDNDIYEDDKISIGMTEEEVLNRWGEPEDINRTITEHNVSEQWIYSNYQYLYFENGILTTIQQ